MEFETIVDGRTEEVLIPEDEPQAFKYIRGQQKDPDELWITHDRKVSPVGWFQEKDNRWVPTIGNSFGLPAMESCPGHTEFCRQKCYGLTSEQGKNVYNLLKHNLDLLEDKPVEFMTSKLNNMLDKFSAHFDAYKLDPKDKIFRIHWDGDFFSEEYAKAWANAIQNNPDIAFWVYTRSFTDAVNVIPYLHDIDNLALYLSVDDWNHQQAKEIRKDFPNVLFAYCTSDYLSVEKIADDKSYKICPENNGQMKLMNNGRGACADCRLCIDKKTDIVFSSSHRASVDCKIDCTYANCICRKEGAPAAPNLWGDSEVSVELRTEGRNSGSSKVNFIKKPKPAKDLSQQQCFFD